jgi:type I restriction enzyme, S subunit
MRLIENKSEWRRVRLDEVIEKREENDRANARTRFDNFIAGEHLDPESLHVSRMGSQREEELPPSFYKIFRKGQILFMTRRPYLRKNALAHCDGICGEKMLTLQVREEVADAKLIPFLFHSEGFYAHTTGCMIGSTNPHCRWRDVARYEFLLPPKDQQAKIAELLWAADARLLSQQKSKASLDLVLKAFVHDRILNHPKATEMRLEEVTESMEGGKSPVCESESYVPGTHGILKTSAVTSGKFVSSEAKTVKTEDLESLSVSVEADSILINRKNTRELVGVSCYVDESHPHLFLSDLIWQIRANEKALPKYLFFILSSTRLRNRFSALSNGTSTTMVNIAKGSVAKIRVNLPPLEEQRAILREIERIEQSAESLEVSICTSKNLLKSLINQIF